MLATMMNMFRYVIVSALCFACAASTAFAADGVVLIDQNRALAGGVAPGDAPGFPVTLSQPGSYRLSGNLTVPANTDGIVIAADRVTLDLNGFSISGGGSGTGITNLAISRRGTTIRNGAVTNFETGIDFSSHGQLVPANFGDDVEQIRALDNHVGIFFGDGGIARGNTVIGNRDAGLFGGQDAIVSGNIASRNAVGIAVFDFAVVTENNVFDNDTGLAVQCPATIIGNTLRSNTTLDFNSFPTGGCTFEHNSAGSGAP